VVEAGLKAMDDLGLSFEDFESDCFPFKLGIELNSFKLFMNMGEAYLQVRSYGEAARYYHLASKLKTDSHKPFLGFAKTYLAAGQLERAEVALAKIPQPGGMNDPETHRLLATICRKRGNLPLAFDCLLKAFEKGPADELNLEPLYFIGAALERWRDMLAPIRAFLLQRGDHAGGYARLSAIHLKLGEDFLAKEAAVKALEIDPKNPVAKSVADRVELNQASQALAASVKDSEGGLTLDIGGGIDLGSQDRVAW
jgi:tetratricopeptide (TPR) repeat protein